MTALPIQMNVEIAAVFDYTGAALYWTSPLDGGPGHIQDSRALWDFIWDRRREVHGIVHSHPMGIDQPSNEDVTTWRAIEKGLGLKLWWPIATRERVTCYHHNPVTGKYEHTRMPLSYDATSDVWLGTIQELRKRSYDQNLPTGEPDDGRDTNSG